MWQQGCAICSAAHLPLPLPVEWAWREAAVIVVAYSTWGEVAGRCISMRGGLLYVGEGRHRLGCHVASFAHSMERV